MSTQDLMKKFEAIAKDHADIATLKEQKSDSLDFHELSVWTIEQLMHEAYQLGKKEAEKKAKKVLK